MRRVAAAAEPVDPRRALAPGVLQGRGVHVIDANPLASGVHHPQQSVGPEGDVQVRARADDVRHVLRGVLLAQRPEQLPRRVEPPDPPRPASDAGDEDLVPHRQDTRRAGLGVREGETPDFRAVRAEEADFAVHGREEHAVGADGQGPRTPAEGNPPDPFAVRRQPVDAVVPADVDRPVRRRGEAQRTIHARRQRRRLRPGRQRGLYGPHPDVLVVDELVPQPGPAGAEDVAPQREDRRHHGHDDHPRDREDALEPQRTGRIGDLVVADRSDGTLHLAEGPAASALVVSVLSHGSLSQYRGRAGGFARRGPEPTSRPAPGRSFRGYSPSFTQIILVRSRSSRRSPATAIGAQVSCPGNRSSFVRSTCQ